MNKTHSVIIRFEILLRLSGSVNFSGPSTNKAKIFDRDEAGLGRGRRNASYPGYPGASVRASAWGWNKDKVIFRIGLKNIHLIFVI